MTMALMIEYHCVTFERQNNDAIVVKNTVIFSLRELL